ncbi:PREDICTED: adenine phosphoribosyltransferase isoform X2 [Polistes dominula]|uniref:adenine phosphoribosyltransferase n=1 Tax=Polistes dominula TaxID=743375 RepID=A0ABM1IHF3_POLDO|nr:PREDICTED: adenine phosphoribosyltransferase isoform X2 [Polistes dominula]
MDKSQKLKLLKDSIKNYEDFPKPGIIFRDIFPVFQNTLALKAMRDLLVEHVLFLEVDLIVGLDSRGFLLGPMICVEIDKPFIPIRKKGKLPGKVARQSYNLEYGEATFELQVESIKEGTRVLIIDDLLATGVYIQVLWVQLLNY